MRFPLLFAASAGCGALASFYHPQSAAQVACAPKQCFSHEFKGFTIGEIRDISHNTKVFRFLLDDPEQEFRLKVCGTLQARIPYVTQQMQRLYTPVTANGTKGHFEIIVKRMPKGQFTTYLWERKVGDNVQFRAVGYNQDYRANRWKNVGLIAGGVGFTPILQVIHHSLHLPKDKTELTFLFCNRTKEDILLKDYLDNLAAQHDRLKVVYCIDNPEPGWTGLTGIVSENMIRKTMPPPNDEGKSKIFLCGPDRMISHLAGVPDGVLKKWSGGVAAQPSAPGAFNHGPLAGIFGSMGYQREEVYVF